MDLKKSQLSEEADRIDEEWSWFGYEKVARFLSWRSFFVVVVGTYQNFYGMFLDEFLIFRSLRSCAVFLGPKTMWLPKDCVFCGGNFAPHGKVPPYDFIPTLTFADLISWQRWILLLWWCMPEGFWRGASCFFLSRVVFAILCNLYFLVFFFFMGLVLVWYQQPGKTLLSGLPGVTSPWFFFWNMCLFCGWKYELADIGSNVSLMRSFFVDLFNLNSLTQFLSKKECRIQCRGTQNPQAMQQNTYQKDPVYL